MYVKNIKSKSALDDDSENIDGIVINKKGEFNVPYGKSQNVNFVDKKNLLLASKILKKTKIYNLDYKSIIEKFCEKKDLVFLDL